MLNHNAALPHQALTSFAHNDDIFSENSSLFSRLSMLSKRPNWLLFTAGATLPTNQELQSFGIEAHKVIKIKESHSMTEKDIILKALNAKNASAIVASDNFSIQDKEALKNQASQSGCEIFFMDSTIQQTLTRHLH
ncbi:hypothetical protein [Vibrio sp. E150_018]